MPDQRNHVLTREAYRKWVYFQKIGPSYPVTAEVAAREIYERGGNATLDKLRKLSSGPNPEITLPDSPHRHPKWTESAIDQAADWFDARRDYTDSVIMCKELGLSYEDYCRALKEAYDEVFDEFGEIMVVEFGTNIGGNPDHRDDADGSLQGTLLKIFDMHVHPLRFPEPARVTFTLCDDVREYLENHPRNKKAIKAKRSK